MNSEETKEKYITLGDIFYSLKKRLRLLIIITLVVTALGSVYTLGIAKEKYKSTITLMVAAEETGASEVNYTNSLRLIDTVSSLITEDIVLNEVAKQFIDSDAEEDIIKYSSSLRQSISISSKTTSFLIKVSVVNEDANLAKDQANAIGETLINVCNDPSYNISNLLKGAVSQTSKATIGVYDSPNKPLYLIISFAGGLVLAFVVALCLELASTKFKTKNDIRYETNEEIIGEILYAKDGNLDLSREITSLKDVEPFNKVFSNIKFLSSKKNSKTIMVTSTTSGELKSTLISGLALAISKYGKKVVVIDLDLRLPSIHKVFRLSKGNGVADYIAGEASYEDIIKQTPNDIDVITSGNIPSAVNPVLLLENDRLSELVDRLKEEYDYVLFDTTPVLPCNDSLILANKVDGVIYNVAIDTSKKKDFKECVKKVKATNANLLGLCVTKLKVSSKEYNAYYYYGASETK